VVILMEDASQLGIMVELQASKSERAESMESTDHRVRPRERSSIYTHKELKS